MVNVSKFRAVIRSIVDTKYFEYVSLVVILVNSVLLAMNDAS